MDALGRFDVAVGVGDDVELAAPCADLLQIRLELFQQRIVGRDRDDGHARIDQGERPVLKLACGIRLGMDVGNLLELERAFEGDRVVQATPEKKRILLFGEALGPGDDRRLERQHGLDCGRQVAQRVQPVRLALRGQTSAQFGEREREQEQRRQLRRESLGRRDTDLGAGAGEIGERSLTHHRARRDVADPERVSMAERSRVPERGQRIGGLPRLRNDHDQRIGVRDAVAVSVLAGDLRLRGDARHAFEPQARHHAGVVARPAREDMHRIDRRQDLFGAAAKERGIDASDAFERIGNRARLLEDFLLHEVSVRPELDRCVRDVHRDFLPRRGHAVDIVNSELLPSHVGDIAFFQVDDALGDLRERGRVGRKKMIVISHADEQGAPRACAYQAARLACADRRDRVGAAELRDRLANRGKQISVVIRVNEVGNDLGVGLGDEAIALLLQALPQGLEVFDDPVVDDRHFTVADMRVRVVGGRRAVRRPARV